MDWPYLCQEVTKTAFDMTTLIFSAPRCFWYHILKASDRNPSSEVAMKDRSSSNPPGGNPPPRKTQVDALNFAKWRLRWLPDYRRIRNSLESNLPLMLLGRGRKAREQPNCTLVIVLWSRKCLRLQNTMENSVFIRLKPQIWPQLKPYH